MEFTGQSRVRRDARRMLAAGGLAAGLAGSMSAPVMAEAADGESTTVSSVTVEAADKGYAASTVTVGGKEPVSVLDVPNTIRVITQQRIQDQNLVTMVDALAQVPGVHVTTWDGLIGQIRSRG